MRRSSARQAFRTWAGFLAVWLIFVSSACRIPGSGGSRLSGEPVRLGYFPNLAHAPALVGLEKGFFSSELGGKEIKTYYFDAGPALMESLASGRLDAGYVGPVPAMTFFSRGYKIKIVAGASEAGAIMVVDPRSGIDGVEDLRGRVAAVPQLTNTQDIVLRLLLEEYGLTDIAWGGDVTIIQIPPADLPAVVRQGQIQAALVPEPWGSQLEKQSGLRTLLDWNQVWAGGAYPAAVLVMREDFLAGRPAEAEAVLRAHRRAIEFIRNNPEEAASAVGSGIARVLGREIPADLIGRGLERSRFSGEIDLKVLEEMAGAARRARYLRRDIDVKTLVQQ